MGINLIYITVGSRKEAEKIGRELVSSRLAACANIIDNMNSFYWWEGEIQNDRETILIVKTREALVEQVIERVKSLHSYDCPCIVSLPVLNGNRAFLDWVEEETLQEGH